MWTYIKQRIVVLYVVHQSSNLQQDLKTECYGDENIAMV